MLIRLMALAWTAPWLGADMSGNARVCEAMFELPDTGADPPPDGPPK